jgi:hypothetical protein
MTYRGKPVKLISYRTAMANIQVARMKLRMVIAKKRLVSWTEVTQVSKKGCFRD